MCGITGSYWKTKRPDNAAAAVDRMVSAISHRGPDSDGRSSSEFAEVGFKRLSIIDLATGDQPLTNEDGSVECFLNGEIYNYLELRAELLSKGHVFHTSSDTEVLPHLYEDFGEMMFAKLNGMFSICVIDHRRRLMLLARDHFGVKQMYYSETGRNLVFGSEMKAILASGLVDAEIDEASILPYLTLFYSPEPHTLVKGVKKLPPGCVLKVREHREAEVTKYYELPREAQVTDLSLEEATERVTELLKRSISLQLQADVPVGISLSGGLDSSAIASLAFTSETVPSELLAITISWPDTAPEELRCSRQLCEQLGLQQEIIQPAESNVEADLPLLAWISDEPIADPATYSQFRVAQAAGQWVKVLLGGAGGDELFGGYGNYVLSSKKAAFARLPRALQGLAYRHFASRWIDCDSAEALMSYRDSRFWWHRQTIRNVSSHDEALLKSAIPQSRLPFENFERLFDHFSAYDPANQQMLVDLQAYLPEQVLPMMDRATMAASVEGRVPFLDVPLAEFCYRLSGRTKMGMPAVQKRLLKKALEKLVPSEIIQRRKSGMPSHFSMLIAQNPTLVRQLLARDESYVKSIVPSAWLAGMLVSEQQMRKHSRVLYALVILEVWRQLFIEQKAYDRPDMAISELFAIPSRSMAAKSR